VKLELLIIDANVLIDFCKTDANVLRLVTGHVGKVHVAEPVLAEVKQLDRVTAEGHGLHVVQAELPLLKEAAAAAVRSPLRFQDWICLLLAKEKSWTCITNDKRLRTECETRTVQVMWGLQLLLRLVERRALPAKDAIELAEAIHRVNRRIARDVVDTFIRNVKKVK
jgi:predicted nucleic acid-binding protein